MRGGVGDGREPVDADYDPGRHGGGPEAAGFSRTQGVLALVSADEGVGPRFEQMLTPRRFGEDPALAWGFFGHRSRMYREAVPYAGFELLRGWTAARPHFIFASNVDGQFQKAGIDEDAVCECRGSIHFLQCLNMGATRKHGLLPGWRSSCTRSRYGQKVGFLIARHVREWRGRIS